VLEIKHIESPLHCFSLIFRFQATEQKKVRASQQLRCVPCMRVFNDPNSEASFSYSSVTKSPFRVPVVLYCTLYCIIVVFGLMKHQIPCSCHWRCGRLRGDVREECLMSKFNNLWPHLVCCSKYENVGDLCSILRPMFNFDVHYTQVFFNTGCPGGNVPDFGRIFLRLKYTDITQNTYIRIWTVTEIMSREKYGLLVIPRTVSVYLFCVTCRLRLRGTLEPETAQHDSQNRLQIKN
jgi:hypothetical protein